MPIVLGKATGTEDCSDGDGVLPGNGVVVISLSIGIFVGVSVEVVPGGLLGFDNGDGVGKLVGSIGDSVWGAIVAFMGALVGIGAGAFVGR